MKKVIRIIIALVLVTPSAPFFWFLYSFFGFAFIMSAHSIVTYPFNYLLDDTDSMEENKDDLYMLLLILYTPIYYWYNFAIGDFDELKNT